MKKIIIATTKSWNVSNAEKLILKYKEKYEIRLISEKKRLLYESIKDFQPDYIFFPHWSWKISKGIYEDFQCIVFHTSNLPEGRGGSPIQNQIQRKIYNSSICAIRVVEGYDQGDIYDKCYIDLSDGTIEDILKEISNIVFSQMIPRIVEGNLTPQVQNGQASYYERRTPEMSNMMHANINDLKDMYDFIRMLDGEDYPKANIRLGKYSIQFSDAGFSEGKLEGRFLVNEE